MLSVIERFVDNDMLPIYRHLQSDGRMLPEGLEYVESWIEFNFARCFQLMRCDDLCLFQEWTLKWRGSGVTFEIVPVVPSAATMGVVAGTSIDSTADRCEFLTTRIERDTRSTRHSVVANMLSVCRALQMILEVHAKCPSSTRIPYGISRSDWGDRTGGQAQAVPYSWSSTVISQAR
jgi:Domain of unknown function (DUF3303)